MGFADWQWVKSKGFYFLGNLSSSFYNIVLMILNTVHLLLMEGLWSEKNLINQGVCGKKKKTP